MNATTPMFPSAVPILGQTFKVLVVYSTAIIECQCDAKSVLPLHGNGRPTICPACSRAFGIADGGRMKVGELVSKEGLAHA